LELKDFALRWAEFVTTDTNDDLRPLLGLDAYQAAPKPMRLWSH